MASTPDTQEKQQSTCVACLEPIQPGASICPHCSSSQLPHKWQVISQTLKWIGGIVTIISLVGGVITLSRYYLDWQERHDTVAEIVAAADWLIQSENYLQAWKMYQKASEINPSSSLVRNGRFKLSQRWVRSFQVDKSILDATLNSITEILYRGLAEASPEQTATILAHVGYVQVLRKINRLPVFSDVDSLFQQALQADPDNVYANVMYARWMLLAKPMNVEQLQQAAARFERALATTQQRAYVRRLQFLGFSGYTYAFGDEIERSSLITLIRACIDMMQAGEAPPQREARFRILDGYGRRGEARHVEALIIALPGEAHLKAYEWLLAADDDSRSDMNNQSTYVKARLNEQINNREQALEYYRALLETDTRDGLSVLINKGIERLTGKLPERALARNYHDDDVDESNPFQFHLDTLEHFESTSHSENFVQAVEYFEAQITQNPDRLTALAISLPTFIERVRESVRQGDEIKKLNAYTTGFSLWHHDNARHNWLALVLLHSQLLKTGNQYEQALALVGDVLRAINTLDDDWQTAQARLDYEMAVLYAELAKSKNRANDREQALLFLQSAVAKGVTDSQQVSWQTIKGDSFAALANDSRYQELIRGR